MRKLLFLLLISFFSVYPQSALTKAQIVSYEVDIHANETIKIVLYNADSTISYTLFNNIIGQNQKLVFITQPQYFIERKKYLNKITIPFPTLVSGLYYIYYYSPDTCYTKKMLFLK
jgi:hypothetical protein